MPPSRQIASSSYCVIVRQCMCTSPCNDAGSVTCSAGLSWAYLQFFFWHEQQLLYLSEARTSEDQL